MERTPVSTTCKAMQKSRTEQFFRMDDRTWDRHASGLNVWTRFATLPFLFLAGWSHVWIGPWGAGAAVSAVALWLWVNPRLFPLPVRTDTWHAKATFGERVWVNRARVPIPVSHARNAQSLTILTVLGFLSGFYGALANHFWIMLAGALATYVGKVWFLNAMVLLYQDMKDKDPIYRSWLRVPSNDNRKRDRAA